MHIITTSIPDEMNEILSSLANELSKSKELIVREAITSYLEDKMDVAIALSRLKEEEEETHFSEIQKIYGLAD